MSPAPSSSGTVGLCNPFLSNGSLNTLRISGDVINNRERFPWGPANAVTTLVLGGLRVSRKLQE
jgi:hypothetical protein